MDTSSSQPSDHEQFPTQLARIASIASKHPGFTMSLLAALGYIATHGYYSGKAITLGIPSQFTLGPNAYLDAFLMGTAMTVATTVGVLPALVLDQAVEEKPELSWPLGIGYIAGLLLLSLTVIFWSPARSWLINLYAPLLPAMVLFALSAAFSWFALRYCKRMTSRIATGGLAILLLYALTVALGAHVEKNRTAWRVASLGNEHFVVAGYTDDALLVAPLVSTTPPTYVKEFQYLSLSDPDLRLRNVRYKSVVRMSASDLSVP